MRDNWESIQRSCMDRSVVTKVVEISYSDQKNPRLGERAMEGGYAGIGVRLELSFLAVASSASLTA